MGKIHLQDLDRYQEEARPYQPIKTNKKKKRARLRRRHFGM